MHPSVAINAVKALEGHIIDNYNMGVNFTKKDLIELVNGDTRIRGIRKTIRECMKDFVNLK
jgi:hypothetical protein